MSILVIAEHNNIEVKSSTLNTISAASKLGGEIEVLVLGSNIDNISKEISSYQYVSKVIFIDSEKFENAIAENIEPVILSLAEKYSHILAPATTFGKNVLPRLSALLDVQQISEITEVVSEDTFKRPIYAGSCIATVKSSDSTKVITVRATAFDPANASGGPASIESISADGVSDLSSFVNEEIAQSDRPELTAASIVISGGRGMQSGDNFHLLETIADKLGAAVGASRAAVDAGFVPNDYQVGQTGKIVAPDLYIAVGISGAIQHLAGMKDSKVIVAINKDEDAPIFQVADYGLVADLFNALPELAEQL